MTTATLHAARLSRVSIAIGWTPLWLFVGAFVLRLLGGVLYPNPAYPDSFYYANVAQQLASGHGFSVDYLWNFVEVGGRLPAQAILPVPSNAHWMPLAALIQVPFIWLLGATPFAQSLPFWLAAATAAPLTYLIGRDAGLDDRVSLTAAVLAAFPGAAAPFLSQPDNFALFMPLGALALWLCTRGMGGSRRAFVVGGLVVGLATLSRNDGVLLGIPFALAFLADLWRRRGPERRIGWQPAAGCAIAFLVVVGPWFARQLAVFGSLSPSAANGRILFIREYRELYSISSDTSLAGFLAQGPVALLQSRVGGLLAALLIFAAVPLLLYLVPFVAGAAWRLRRDRSFAPWVVYAIALFAFSGLLFAVHVPYGTFLHSAVALLPHAYLLAAIGIAGAVGWVAARRASWDVRQATRVFLGGTIVITAIATVGATLILGRAWGADQALRLGVADALRSVPAEDRLMSPDAGAYRYFTGHGGIVTPDDPLPVIAEAARAYGVRWLVLESDHLVRSLAPVLAGTEHPSWLSPRPVFSLSHPTAPAGAAAAAPTSPASSTTAAVDPSAAAAPDVAVYAVCFDPADQRCLTP